MISVAKEATYIERPVVPRETVGGPKLGAFAVFGFPGYVPTESRRLRKYMQKFDLVGRRIPGRKEPRQWQNRLGVCISTGPFQRIGIAGCRLKSRFFCDAWGLEGSCAVLKTAVLKDPAYYKSSSVQIPTEGEYNIQVVTEIT